MWSTRSIIQGIVLAPGQVAAENVSVEVQQVSDFSTIVTARTGRGAVASEIQEIVGPAGSGGLPVVPGVGAPQSHWSIPQAQEATGASSQIDVFNPGSTSETVHVDIRLPSGTLSPFTDKVLPQTTWVLNTSAETCIPAGQTYATVIDATGGPGVVVSRSIGLSASATPPPQSGTVVAVDGLSAAAPTGEWVVPAPGTSASPAVIGAAPASLALLNTSTATETYDAAATTATGDHAMAEGKLAAGTSVRLVRVPTLGGRSGPDRDPRLGADGGERGREVPPPAWVSCRCPASLRLRRSASEWADDACAVAKVILAGAVSALPSVLWFRRDPRFHDHPALAKAAGGRARSLALFVVDPALMRPAGLPRRAFLIRTLHDMDRRLHARGSNLVVRCGPPEQVVPEVASLVGAAEVHISADFGPYGAARDRSVPPTPSAQSTLVPTGSPYAVSPPRLTTTSGGPYKVFTPFFRAWHRHGWPNPAASDIQTVEWLSSPSEGIPDEPALPPGLQLPAAGEESGQEAWLHFQGGHLRGYRSERYSTGPRRHVPPVALPARGLAPPTHALVGTWAR